MKKLSRDVSIGELANLLTVDHWFDKFGFSDSSGIDIECTGPRLRRLVNEGYLESKPGPSRRFLYRMSIESRLMMIERHRINKESRGRPKEKPSKNDKEKKITEAHIEARLEYCETILRSANFI